MVTDEPHSMLAPGRRPYCTQVASQERLQGGYPSGSRPSTPFPWSALREHVAQLRERSVVELPCLEDKLGHRLLHMLS